MIYDVVEAVSDVVVLFFGPKLAALATAKQHQEIVQSATVYPRRRAVDFAAKDGAELPAIGVYSLGNTLTNARRQDLRDSLVTVVLDYFARGKDSEALVVQAELAAEAMVGCVDKVYGSAVGVFGAGEAEASVLVTMFDVAPYGEEYYEQRVTVRFEVNERDTGLT